MLSCASCNVTTLPGNFSKNQRRKKNEPGYPRCKKCIGNEEVPNVTDDKSNEFIKNDEFKGGSISVPPKRLVCIRTDECDFCDNGLAPFIADETFMRFVDFNLYPHTGWQVCEKCDKIYEENRKLFVIEKTTLLQMFDNGNFKVLRTPKPPEFKVNIETGWYIMGNALRYNTSEDYFITIYNEEKSTSNTRKKRPYIKELQGWQLL